MPAKKRKSKSNNKSAGLARVFHVSANDVGKPLVHFLSLKLPELPANTVRKCPANRHVQLNGNLCVDGKRLLKKGDVVKHFPFPLAPAASPEAVNIIFRDSHLVVVDKPSGITSVRNETGSTARSRNAGRKQATLEDLLPAVLNRDPPHNRNSKAGSRTSAKMPAKMPAKSVARPAGNARRRSGIPRVYPVHRLDRETSGLILFALTSETEHRLVEMFQHHRVARTYRAVALGKVPAMTIDTLFSRDRGDGLRGSVAAPSPETQRAITHVRPVAHLGSCTLVECRLETGRTHQIRIHLAEKGHMICGEKTYVRQPKGKTVVDQSGAPRLALHAWRLEFRHPITGKSICVESPLSKDLADFVDRLKATKKTGINAT
jgi:23S rRNA pseudouridine1911/1915/1917 synthase